MRAITLLLFLAFADPAPKTILDLQPFRETSSARVKTQSGREGTATLTNLNPTINAWYVLEVAWKDGGTESPVHLENARPNSARILLDDKYPAGIVIAEGNARQSCELFGSVLADGRRSPLAYYPLCGGRVYLRNAVKGHRTALESTVEFLRDRVWGGEHVIEVFHHVMADRYRETGDFQGQSGASPPESKGGPGAALTDPHSGDRRLAPRELGVALAQGAAGENGMTPGAWYAAASPGMWVSLIQPNLVAPAILQSYKSYVSGLDSVEASSLCYLIAFDLSQFHVEYALGTQHPAVGWSERVSGQMKDPALPGPDGIGNVGPLISTGLIRPDIRKETVATFIGGFKRSHGAFKSGDLALQNHGSHYGFIENGVVFSKLQPGLATVFVLNDGSVDMTTWTEADNALLSRIKHARQNGVPLTESNSVPGQLVSRWGPGNWSGSENEKLRSIRSGLALQTIGGKRFLIYAVFSDATPAAMARVFQAYQVSYSMLMDMNALEHTYLAVYRRSGDELTVDHLLRGMSQLDKSGSNENVPRFLGYPDNRDFFYLTRRDAKEVIH